MSAIQPLLDEYGESHQHQTNKIIHWICVPAIMFSLIGLLFSIPMPGSKGIFANWAAVVLLAALLYYARLSIPMFLGFLVISYLLLLGNYTIYQSVHYSNTNLALISLGIFVIAWVGQFIGHKIEGKKPSFLKDIQFLLIGPAWLLHFIYRKLNISY